MFVYVCACVEKLALCVTISGQNFYRKYFSFIVLKICVGSAIPFGWADNRTFDYQLAQRFVAQQGILSQIFSFLIPVALKRLRAPYWSTFFPELRVWYEFMPFSWEVAWSDMQTASSRFIYIRGSVNRFPDFFRMGTFIDSTHMKL